MSLPLLLTSCCAPAGTRGWAEDATLAPGWGRVGESAKHAALDPVTWVPLCAALALQINDADGRLSDWAADRTPVFGTTQAARRASDNLYTATAAAYVATGVLSPAPCGKAPWPVTKLEGFGIGAVAVAAASGLTEAGKSAFERLRPDGSNRESLPSGHASGSAVLATLASRNLRSLPMSREWRSFGSAAVGVLVAGTAWARVEGGRHYPSDVLVGAALGHLVGAFLNDAFLGRDAPVDTEVALGRDRVGLEVMWRL